MPCLYCHQPCGDRSFCDEVCYEAYEEARAEYLAQSECDALLNDEPAPFNENFGTKGNE
jgi:hypothetical protein